MPLIKDRTHLRRLQLLLLAALFVAPVVAAWVVWKYVGEHGVGTTVNMGTLVTPARPLENQPFVDLDGHPIAGGIWRGRWTLVIFTPQGCDDACKKALYNTRQVRTSMHKDIARVQRLLVAGADMNAVDKTWLSQQHEDLIAVIAAGALWQQATAAFVDLAPMSPENVYLVDPLGNLMMFYGADVPPGGMLKDLRKLLKVSQIG